MASTGSGMNNKNGKGVADPTVPDIKDYIFSYGKQGQTERFNSSVEGLAEALGKLHGREAYNLIENREEPTFDSPTRPKPDKDGDIDPVDMEEYKIKLKEVSIWMKLKDSRSSRRRSS